MAKLLDNVFRANTGAIIINEQKQVLVFERKHISGAWQFPQGGINEHELPINTIYRELQEETGIQKEQLQLLEEYPEWLTYELPSEYRNEKTGRGQTQKWFLFRWKGVNIPFEQATDKEFRQWKWIYMKELLELIPEFRKPVYQALYNKWNYYIL